MTLELSINCGFDGRCERVEARDKISSDRGDDRSASPCTSDMPFYQAYAQPLFHFFETLPCQPVLHADFFGCRTYLSGRLDRL